MLCACGRIGFDAVGGGEPCPPGYVELAGGKYRFVDSSITWIAAELACEAEGTHLAVPDTADESLALAAAFVPGSDPAFIGINDRLVEGAFRPVTGGTPSVSLFERDEPNGGSDADGVSLREDGLWGDENDADRMPYICECDGKPADPTAF